MGSRILWVGDGAATWEKFAITKEPAGYFVDWFHYGNHVEQEGPFPNMPCRGCGGDDCGGCAVR